jgi:hypothetical protein
MALAGLIAALWMAAQVLGTNSPPTPAQTAAPPCSGCDARHARLRASPPDALEPQE